MVESPFAAVRLRSTAGTRDTRVEASTAVIWKLLQVAEHSVRRLNAPELLPLVFAGIQFVDGMQTPVMPKETAA